MLHISLFQLDHRELCVPVPWCTAQRATWSTTPATKNEAVEPRTITIIMEFFLATSSIGLIDINSYLYFAGSLIAQPCRD